MGNRREDASDRSRKPLPPPPWLREHVVLAEADPDLSLFAWRWLRRVRLWSETPGGDRGDLKGLFEAPPAPIAAALAAFPQARRAALTLLRLRIAPERITAEQVARSCRVVANWLLDGEELLLALAFAEAAARQDLNNPALANLAGRSARRAGMLDRSEIWFDRGHVLSAQQRNRRELIWALLGRGVLLRTLGEYSEACACFERAARFASGTRRSRLAGMAHHELVAIAAETGDYRLGETHAWDAFSHYPLHHPALPNLVHDFVVLLIRNSLFSEALTLARAVLPYFDGKPAAQAMVSSAIARAAASAGKRGEYLPAREAALALPTDAAEFSAAILVNLAEAARAVGSTAEARRLVLHALPIAREKQDVIVEHAALKLEEALSAGTPPARQEQPPAGSNLALLIRLLVSRLRARGKVPPRPVKVDSEASGRMDRPLAS